MNENTQCKLNPLAFIFISFVEIGALLYHSYSTIVSTASWQVLLFVIFRPPLKKLEYHSIGVPLVCILDRLSEEAKSDYCMNYGTLGYQWSIATSSNLCLQSPPTPPPLVFISFLLGVLNV